MNIGIFLVTEALVYRQVGRWVRETRSWQVVLRPTKGWKKDSRRVRKIEFSTVRPRHWKSGTTRTKIQ